MLKVGNHSHLEISILQMTVKLICLHKYLAKKPVESKYKSAPINHRPTNSRTKSPYKRPLQSVFIHTKLKNFFFSSPGPIAFTCLDAHISTRKQSKAVKIIM